MVLDVVMVTFAVLSLLIHTHKHIQGSVTICIGVIKLSYTPFLTKKISSVRYKQKLGWVVPTRYLKNNFCGRNRGV